MVKDESWIWKDTVSDGYKAVHFVLASSFLTASIIGEFWIIFKFPDVMGINPDAPAIIFQVLHYFLIGLVGFIIVICTGALIWYFKDYFPKYFITQDQLVLTERNMWGKQTQKTLEIKKIQTICVTEGTGEGNSFWFYEKTVREIQKECPPDFLWEFKFKFPLDCFFGYDLAFSRVDKPIRLLKVLESLLPLQQHPNYPNVFQRKE